MGKSKFLMRCDPNFITNASMFMRSDSIFRRNGSIFIRNDQNFIRGTFSYVFILKKVKLFLDPYLTS
jgi:hypothetical protein